ncbi:MULTISPECIES: tetratricopeptide repeat protein [Streptomyces]|uniref:tetratricopeptide repeat protein n=1 Tax=Streptomyces TaxID=1883 RepID=UPI0019AD910E|nr:MULTISPECIES: tetratricopeptide repeat protein [Streptomyces]GGS88482.1 hypothetical protein GCM10010286_11530 [Streptomyces toxytricini]
MRDSHRGEAERLLQRAVDEEARRAAGAGAPFDGAALLTRGLQALDSLAASAAEEYEAYVRALDASDAGAESLGEAFRRQNTSTALLVTAVAAAAAAGADLSLGFPAGAALTAGAVTGVAGAAAAVAKVTAGHLPAANRRAGERGRPGGPEQLRLKWLTALEVRGIRPFLEQQRAVAAAARAPRQARQPRPAAAAPPPRGGDRSAQARRRSVLEQSFGQLPEPAAEFTGRRAELARIAQWVQAARASTETRPVVVVLYGEPGVGRTALALRAADALRDQFRGACVVDLRGGSPGGRTPLPVREALLHLLNRLGAPREQLLFREGSSVEQQVRRLGELYHQQVQGLPVTVVLDDAVDAEQVRPLVPERSESLVLVTARAPLELPGPAAWVHQLPVQPLPAAEAADLVRAAAAGAGAVDGPDDAAVAELVALAAGLPLALRALAPAAAPRETPAAAGGAGVSDADAAAPRGNGRAPAVLTGGNEDADTHAGSDGDPGAPPTGGHAGSARVAAAAGGHASAALPGGHEGAAVPTGSGEGAGALPPGRHAGAARVAAAGVGGDGTPAVGDPAAAALAGTGVDRAAADGHSAVSAAPGGGGAGVGTPAGGGMASTGETGSRDGTAAAAAVSGNAGAARTPADSGEGAGLPSTGGAMTGGVDTGAGQAAGRDRAAAAGAVQDKSAGGAAAGTDNACRVVSRRDAGPDGSAPGSGHHADGSAADRAQATPAATGGVPARDDEGTAGAPTGSGHGTGRPTPGQTHTTPAAAGAAHARSDEESTGAPTGSSHGTGGPTASRTHAAPAAVGAAHARSDEETDEETAGAPAGSGHGTGGPTAGRTHTTAAAPGGGAGAPSGADAGTGGAAPGGAGAALAGGAGAGQVLERALARAYGRLPEDRQRLLRRLTLAGRASFGPSAAAALIGTGPVEAARLLHELARAGLLDHVRGERFRMHDAVRAYAAARLAADGDRAGAAAAHGRLIRDYAQLADAVIRMVDGQTSTRSGHFGGHGFASLEAALRWLDEESSFITAALRHAGDVDDLQAVLDLLGALCDFCLLRGDLYRLGEIDELTRAVEAARRGRPGQGRLVRSVQWRTGIAARQLGELDRARTTLSSVVDQYREARQDAGAAMALVSLGITLHHQGRLRDAAARIREALELQAPAELAGDRAWALHALAAVERDSARLAEALGLLRRSLALHREHGSVHGEAWAQFQLGQVYLRLGEVPQAEEELHRALDLYGRTRDDRGRAWAMTQLGRARVVDGDPGPAVERLREALARHREAEDARGEAWTLYYLGQALEEAGEPDEAVRELERARTMFSRMRDVYGLAHARHHSGRVTRDLRAARTGSLRNSGFARQLLVDARADFRRIGLAHGEAWTCLELAVVDAGNDRTAQALDLCEEAARLFISYGDRRGEDWARFMRCTLLPYAAPGGGAEEARAELARLSGAPHPARDGRLADCLDAYAVVLARGVDPAEGWQGWRLSMVPDLHAQEVMGVPMPPAV